MIFIGKIVVLVFNDAEEKKVEKAIAALADIIPLEAMQLPQSPALIFPGLEIRLRQHRVLKDGALCYLAASQALPTSFTTYEKNRAG